MEYYTEDELSLRKLKNPVLLSLAILVVTIFVDLAPILQSVYIGEGIAFTVVLGQIVLDFGIALITFVVSNFIYQTMSHASILNYFIWVVTILEFVSLVLFKLFNNNLWLLLTLCFSICNVLLLCLYCIKIRIFVKQNGRRLPC